MKYSDYDRIAQAIGYIRANFKERPTLEDIADSCHLSPYHFQRMFTEWAGVSPKKFIHYLSLENAKEVLKESGATLSDASFRSGLSGTGRLHDMFIKIEGMTPGEYKKGGQGLAINYDFRPTPFGEIMLASTTKGICYMVFAERRKIALEGLEETFPEASILHSADNVQDKAMSFFNEKGPDGALRLHLRGTPFQIKVWEALIRIPKGLLTTYASVAGSMGRPGAHRAVANAIAKNPVAYLIPCHRVIRSNGEPGGYRWGTIRKSAMIGREASLYDNGGKMK